MLFPYQIKRGSFKYPRSVLPSCLHPQTAAGASRRRGPAGLSAAPVRHGRPPTVRGHSAAVLSSVFHIFGNIMLCFFFWRNALYFQYVVIILENNNPITKPHNHHFVFKNLSRHFWDLHFQHSKREKKDRNGIKC